jgi:hypothetical protein
VSLQGCLETLPWHACNDKSVATVQNLRGTAVDLTASSQNLRGQVVLIAVLLR